MRQEDWFKASLVLAMAIEMDGAVTLRHEDKFTAGIPDISNTWRGSTTWWEAKAVCPQPGRELKSDGSQRLTCLRLAAIGAHCRYIVWLEDGSGQWTGIVHPSRFIGLPTKVPAKQVLALFENYWAGHDMKTLARYIARTHDCIDARTS